MARGKELRMGSRLEQWSTQLQLWELDLLARLEERLGVGLGGAEDGQSTMEYAVIAALIVVVAITAINIFGAGIGQVFTRVVARIQGLG